MNCLTSAVKWFCLVLLQFLNMFAKFYPNANPVSAMMICGIPTMEEEFLRFEEDKAMGCGNLSSTLQKLYMWERKLLQEVKV